MDLIARSLVELSGLLLADLMLLISRRRSLRPMLFNPTTGPPSISDPKECMIRCNFVQCKEISVNDRKSGGQKILSQSDNVGIMTALRTRGAETRRGSALHIFPKPQEGGHEWQCVAVQTLQQGRCFGPHASCDDLHQAGSSHAKDAQSVKGILEG